MKIVFTATGKDWNAHVDSVFGRAEGYILYNEEEKKISWFSNEENRNTGHGAGIQAGQNVAGLGADVVITGGKVGPKAFDVLKNAGITIYSIAGNKTVKEAFDLFKKGELIEY